MPVARKRPDFNSFFTCHRSNEPSSVSAACLDLTARKCEADGRVKGGHSSS